MAEVKLPYFDFLLSRLAAGDPSVAKSFGRHVHWGYWSQPDFADLSDDDFARAAEQMTQEVCQLAKIQEGQRVLDVGCGFGGTVAYLNERFDQLELTGLNIDARQIERARQMVKPNANNIIEFCEGDACQLPFPDHSFDCLLAVECIFHFPSREAFFQEALRVLRSGGRLVLSDFVPSLVFAPICRIDMPAWLQQISGLGELNVKYTLGAYRALAKRTGLTIHLQRNITAHTLPTYDYLARIVPDQNASLYKAFLKIQKFLGSSELVRYQLLSLQKP